MSAISEFQVTTSAKVRVRVRAIRDEVYALKGFDCST